MPKQPVGTCSVCGGMVSIESPYWSVVPPVPQCETCGGRPKNPHGPVIEITPPSPPLPPPAPRNLRVTEGDPIVRGGKRE